MTSKELEKQARYEDRRLKELNKIRKQFDKPPIVPKEIHCLRCSIPFVSYAIDNKLCYQCNQYASYSFTQFDDPVGDL